MTGFLILLAGAILGVVTDRLFRWYTKKTRRDTKAIREAGKASVITAKERIGREGLASEVLRRFYGANALHDLDLSRHVVTVSGTSRQTDVVTRKVWRNLGFRIAHDTKECLLIGQNGSCPSLSGPEREQFLRGLEAEGRRITDNPIFRLVSFDASPTELNIGLKLDSFHNFLCSTGSLESELYHALIDGDFSPEKVLKDPQRNLPLRCKFLPDAKAIIGFGSRMCAGGPHVLMAFKRPAPSGNDYVFFARRRSTEVATGESVMGLLPIGYHQPTSRSTAINELPLAMTVYREAYEELFGGSELEDKPKYVTPGWYLQKYHPLSWFLDNPGSFTMEIVSLGLSLMHGNYEFAILLAVHDPQFWVQFNKMIQLNWEVDDTETPLISTADPSQLARLVKGNTWNGSALFSLAECLQRIAELDTTGAVHLPEMTVLLV